MSLHTADERSVLEGLLDVQRAEISLLLDEVDDTEARTRLVPSATTVLGLVKHAVFVERVWFHARVAGVPREHLGLPASPADSFVLTDADTIASVRADFDEACDISRAVAADHDLDETWPWHDGPVSLRYVYGHMIAELARHAGHGDILVEQLLARRTSGGV
ncbi:DinB family protein [Aeromicrobium sp. CnD17-E]|uniref:DinB family protein n=1 Tax=Aeromicrobium sp. CnD17-E TaxID=2954487 RepID=UPI0020977F2B|nr:DinB family protein [Aeromicrobium sp. CnD17-E]MCO7240198.1 DinB family protein [Aeromicrobium sp. CnD17-E]